MIRRRAVSENDAPFPPRGVLQGREPATQPDLVVVDLHLGHEDGIEVVESLRAELSGRSMVLTSGLPRRVLEATRDTLAAVTRVTEAPLRGRG